MKGNVAVHSTITRYSLCVGMITTVIIWCLFRTLGTGDTRVSQTLCLPWGQFDPICIFERFLLLNRWQQRYETS